MRAACVAGLVLAVPAIGGCERSTPVARDHGLIAVSGACLTDDTGVPLVPDEPEPREEPATTSEEKGSAPCAVSAESLARDEDAILASGKPGSPGKPIAFPPWDRSGPPARLVDVMARFALTKAEVAALQKNGFAVLARASSPSYASAFHEIYQSELPLFVSADSVLHAVARSTDHLRLSLEARVLQPTLERSLALLHCALPELAQDLPLEPLVDVDVLVTVARSLLAGHRLKPSFAESGPALAHILAALAPDQGEASIDLFGRQRRVDLGAWSPRGGAVSDPRLAGYARALAWLAAAGLERSSPRERRVAEALATVVRRSGAATGLAAVETALDRFDGPRVDRPLGETDAQAPVTSLVGVRSSLAPRLLAGFVETRELGGSARATGGLSGSWIAAVRSLAEPTRGSLPSFMASAPYGDLRFDTTFVALGEALPRALLAPGAEYDRTGCAIPDAFVEPVPALYGKLAEHAEEGARAAAEIDASDAVGARATFARMARVLRVLERIASRELAGATLSEAELHWLGSIVEVRDAPTSQSPSFGGWYFDLFASTREALAPAAFAADVATAGDVGLRRVGASAPRLGVFVVDTGGAPRVVVGPVARGFVQRREAEAPDDPWAMSYAVPAPDAPHLTFLMDGDEATVSSPERLGQVTVALCDHHRRPIQSETRFVGAGEGGEAHITFRTPPDDRPAEMVHVHVQGAELDRWLDLAGGSAGFDTTRAE